MCQPDGFRAAVRGRESQGRDSADRAQRSHVLAGERAVIDLVGRAQHADNVALGHDWYGGK